MRFFVACFMGLGLSTSLLAIEGYQRATDDKENVKKKKFTKAERIELNLPDIGFVLNQSLITTYLIHGGITYYTNEVSGFGIEGSYGLNKDETERTCLETFYNDPNNEVEDECGEGNGLDNKKSNYGPAYMPIRELNYIVAVNYVWNPVYGKQLLWLKATSYFDVFLTFGLGMVGSTYYPESTELRNGKKSRADYTFDKATNTGSLDGGASTNETQLYGIEGRPDPQSNTNVFLNLGIGQRYHFWKRFALRFEIRNMTLFGTPSGFENLVAMWVGIGPRL